MIENGYMTLDTDDSSDTDESVITGTEGEIEGLKRVSKSPSNHRSTSKAFYNLPPFNGKETCNVWFT